MRVLIQRVSEARVEIEGAACREIGQGLLLLLGIEETDSTEDIDWLCAKVTRLRIFNDGEGKMNLSVKDVGGKILVVSQFTLHASTKKGNRPSFVKAAHPDKAIPLYKQFIATLQRELGSTIETGEFGADMQVQLVNDGPVTILIDSKNKE